MRDVLDPRCRVSSDIVVIERPKRCAHTPCTWASPRTGTVGHGPLPKATATCGSGGRVPVLEIERAVTDASARMGSRRRTRTSGPAGEAVQEAWWKRAASSLRSVEPGAREDSGSMFPRNAAVHGTEEAWRMRDEGLFSSTAAGNGMSKC
mgnify:CR=1 FL=1